MEKTCHGSGCSRPRSLPLKRCRSTAASALGRVHRNAATLVTPTFRLPVPKLYLTTMSSEWNRASGAGIRPNQEVQKP